MKKGLKIVTIGGGSSYTPEFVEGLIKRNSELPVSELWLVDIKEGEEKLNIVGNLAKRMIEKAGLQTKVYLTLDRREALKDADFVTTQLRVGLLQARAKDERIPLSHGILGQETNGAGGMFKAFRTIPVILQIANDIHELCPNAWLINFTNPAGMVTEALIKYSPHKKVIGVCNVPIGIEMAASTMLGEKREDLSFKFLGLNHCVFGTEVKKDNKDLMNDVMDKMINPDSNVQVVANVLELKWEPSFLKALGVLPCPYHRYYYKTKEMLDDELEAFKKGETRAEIVIKTEQELFELYKDVNLKEKPEQLSKRGGAHYSDVACNLISSIYNDKGDIQTVDTINGDTIPYLDPSASIEVSSYITKNGPVPVKGIKLPNAVKGLISNLKSFETLAIEAAVTGDYNTALLAMVTNPLVANDVVGKEVLDELLEAHKEYLPQFFKNE